MSEQAEHLQSLTTPFVRSLAALGFVIIFFVAATLIRPGDSGATPGAAPAMPDPHRPAAPAPEQTYPLLGSLLGPDYTTHIHSTPDGPRYTVFDAGGERLAHLMTADEIYQTIPGYNIPDMKAAVGEVDVLDVHPEF